MATRKNTVKYSNTELMVVMGARLMWDGAVVIAESGFPLVCALLAQKVRAPNIKIVLESGYIITNSSELPLSVNDPCLIQGTSLITDMRSNLCELLQKGHIDIGLLSGNQIDKYGNINSTSIGNYKKPKLRLAGSNTSNDIASLSKNTFIITKHEPRKLHPCDYITAPGHLKGANSRSKSGLLGEGPKYIITDLCVFDFHPRTKKARVISIHPNVTKKDIIDFMSFKPIFPFKIPTTKPPTLKELKILRNEIDPKRYYLD